MLTVLGISMFLFGVFLLVISVDWRGGYGPPIDLVFGLGVLVTAMGLILAILSTKARTTPQSIETEEQVLDASPLQNLYSKLADNEQAR